MCGRYAITLPPEALRAIFRYVEQPNFPPRYNIAPTQPVPIVHMTLEPDGTRARHLTLVRWGFLPGFVKDPKDFPLVINARAETLADKPSFRTALRHRRCIFIADAFYEWKRRPGKISKPFLIRRADHAPMAMAGLWETWMGPNGEETDSACIITTDANGPISAIHHRMPVILEPENFDAWLDPLNGDVDEMLALAKPAADDVLEFFEISTAVNRVSNDSADIQLPSTSDDDAPEPKKARVKKTSAQGSLF